MSTTYKGVLIEIERVRDGGWHWRLDKGEWSYDSFFMQGDALKASKAGWTPRTSRRRRSGPA